MSEIDQFLSTCRESVRRGADELLAWRGRFSPSEKSARDLVTEADVASQRAIAAVIYQSYPDHGFLGEEDPDPKQLEKPYCWIVDPLDGTTNYVHDFPCYGVSVALAREGQLIAGAVLDPVRDECFEAGLAKGCWLNGKQVFTSRTSTVSQALVAVSFPPDLRDDSPDLQSFLRMAPLCQAVRRTGSAALNLAYVASGRLDAHWAHFIHSWDSAAGVLLVREAGGVATSFDGGDYQLPQGDYFVAGTNELHQSIHAIISAPPASRA